jgi:hypothetical protein
MDQQRDFVRSPGLNTLEVHLWEYLKSMVYAAEFSNLQDMQQQI